MRQWLGVAGGGVLAVGLVIAAGVAAPAPAGGPAPVSGEAALAATLQWTDLIRVTPGEGPVFWPELPQFNTGLEAGRAPLADVAADFDYVGPDAERAGAQLVSTVVVYPSAADAGSDFAALARTADAGGRTLSGPAVDADQWRYFAKPSGKLTEWTLRWRIGPAVGRVSAIDNSGLGAQDWTPARLAALFRPVAGRARELIGGRLRAPSLPRASLALLPPAADAPGPAIGTALVPAQAWATVDTSRDPVGVFRTLAGGGARTLLERTYRLAGAPAAAVSVVLFPFASPSAADAWVRAFARSVGAKGLSPGKTGSDSAFGSNGGAFYELQFARGRYAGDVACGAPFAATPRACEAATRRLAEAWYGLLAGQAR